MYTGTAVAGWGSGCTSCIGIVMDDRVDEDDGGYALPPLSEEASKASSIMLL